MTLPTLYVHIGRSKTGSTTIQYLVDSNRDLLSSAGLAVPDIGYSHRQHFDLALAMRNLRGAGAQSLVREFHEFLSSAQTDVFISSEFLIGLRKPDIELLATAAKRFRVVILVYIRDYPSLIVSTYNHDTKKGKNYADFDRYYETKKDQFTFVPNVSSFAEVFGWENVRIRSLDPRSLAGGALEFDLLAAIERTHLRESMTFSGKTQNASWSWVKVELMRAAAEALMRVPGMAKGKTLMRAASPFFSHVDRCFPRSNAQYPTASQWNVLRSKYNEDVSFINRRSAKVSVPILDAEGIKERPFLPSLDTLPFEQVDAFASRLHADSRLQNAFPEVYETINAVLTARIVKGRVQ